MVPVLRNTSLVSRVQGSWPSRTSAICTSGTSVVNDLQSAVCRRGNLRGAVPPAIKQTPNYSIIFAEPYAQHLKRIFKPQQSQLIHASCSSFLSLAPSSEAPSVWLAVATVLGLPLALWAYKCLMMVIFQRKIIYMGYAPPGARSEVLGVDVPIPKKLLCEEISLETSDRITLHGILVQEDVPVISRPKQPHVVILYLQGNAGNPLSRLPVFERLLVGSPLGRPARALHISILAVAPRSYWKSSSRTPTEHGIVSDYKHTLSHIAYQYPNSSIVLYGHSLGGSIAVCLASQLSNADYPTVKGLILENPFSSIPDMLRALYPQRWLPYRYLTPFAFDRWDAISAMKIAHHQQSSLLARLSKEMLVLLSEKDEMVPTSMGMALYSASEQSDPAGASTRDHGAGRSAKRLIVIRGALHEHGWMEREWLAVMTEYLQEIQRR